VYTATLSEAAGPLPYDVALPEAGLGWEKVGPLFERYSVNLVGRLDEHWANCYERIAETSPTFARFRLDPAAAGVSFMCRATDGPVEVMSVLRILEGFLERVNREASFAAASPAAEARPAPRPAAPRNPHARAR
jgi:hypothetical protein